MTNPDRKEGHGLSVNEVKGWAHNNLSRIWLVVVLALATLSALAWWHSISLLLLGLGLILGALQPSMCMALLGKGMALLEPLKGNSRMIAIIGSAVILVIFPFILTFVVGVEAGSHFVSEHKLLEFLSRLREK